MKTLKEIKDEVAQKLGYESAENYLSELYDAGSIYTIERINLFINDVAIITAKEALKNASENADTKQGYCSDGWTPSVRVVDKRSILDESNIPEL